MSALLEVKNIGISFGGIRAVQDVSFSVEKGEILGLIGPNGSGKSTCVNLITGVYPVDHGEIWFEGNLIKPTLGIADRARMGMGRTFQSSRPFGNLSVYENVYTIALLKHSPKEAAEVCDEVLEFMGLENDRNMLSAKLSIEKRKWLDLSRILVTGAEFIMMDEVMAGLTPKEMEESATLVNRLQKERGKTILFIEHVMKAVVAICHRCVVLNEGKVLSEGLPEEVLRQPEVITAYLGRGVQNAEN